MEQKIRAGEKTDSTAVALLPGSGDNRSAWQPNNTIPCLIRFPFDLE